MIKTDFLNLAPHDSAHDRQARQRAAYVASGGTRNAHGPLIDFNKSSAPAAISSGLSSTMDLYDTGLGAEIAQRDEARVRFDRLPTSVQRLAQSEGLTDLDLLTVIGAVVAKNGVMGSDAKVQCFASDLGRAIGITSQRADALLDDAARRGFIERFAGNYVRSRI